MQRRYLLLQRENVVLTATRFCHPCLIKSRRLGRGGRRGCRCEASGFWVSAGRGEGQGGDRRVAVRATATTTATTKAKPSYKRQAAGHPGGGRVRRCPRRSRVWKAKAAERWSERRR